MSTETITAPVKAPAHPDSLRCELCDLLATKLYPIADEWFCAPCIVTLAREVRNPPKR